MFVSPPGGQRVIPAQHRDSSYIPRIVVGVDGSAGSVAALRWAATEASRRGARLSIVVAYRHDMTLRPPLGTDAPHTATDVLQQSLAVAGVPAEAVDAQAVFPCFLDLAWARWRLCAVAEPDPDRGDVDRGLVHVVPLVVSGGHRLELCEPVDRPLGDGAQCVPLLVERGRPAAPTASVLPGVHLVGPLVDDRLDLPAVRVRPGRPAGVRRVGEQVGRPGAGPAGPAGVADADAGQDLRAIGYDCPEITVVGSGGRRCRPGPARRRSGRGAGRAW